MTALSCARVAEAAASATCASLRLVLTLRKARNSRTTRMVALAVIPPKHQNTSQ